MADWNAYSYLRERIVTVDCGGRRVQGRVRGLDASGRLILDGPHGEERIVAGDVSVVAGWSRG
jgi:biotin-(acetyl-CoA carboxylase) ligase